MLGLVKLVLLLLWEEVSWRRLSLLGSAPPKRCLIPECPSKASACTGNGCRGGGGEEGENVLLHVFLGLWRCGFLDGGGRVEVKREKLVFGGFGLWRRLGLLNRLLGLCGYSPCWSIGIVR